MQNYRFREITVFANLPFLRNSLVCEITVFRKLPFLQNYHFWEITAFEKLPFSRTYHFWEIPDYAKLPFLENYRFWGIIDFISLQIYTAEGLVGGNYYFSTATDMIGYPIRERMGTTLFWEITVFAKLPFLRNCRFWVIINFFFYFNIYTAEELVGGNYNFSTATEIIGYLIRERMAPPYF